MHVTTARSFSKLPSIVLHRDDEHFIVQHKMKNPFMFRIGRLVFGKQKQMYHISRIELNRDRVYLTFPQGTLLTEGEIFRIVRPLGSYKYDYFSFGCPRNLVAKVKILKFAGNDRVLVQVLQGKVTNGVSAERS